MKNTEALVIGGSAGSLNVLLNILPHLNPDIGIAIVIILHRKADADNLLESLLDAKTQLRVKEANEKEMIENNTIYLAPADYHLLVEKDLSFSLDHSEKINFSRPSIDVTFQSAADAYGPRLTALLLSGANADGVAGLQKIKQAGGRIMIQNPDTAQVSYMPAQAALHVPAEALLNMEQIGPYINQIFKKNK